MFIVCIMTVCVNRC